MKYEMSGRNKPLARRSPFRRQVSSSAISTATSMLMIKRYLLLKSLSSAWTMDVVHKIWIVHLEIKNKFQMPPRTPSAQGHAPSPSPLPTQRWLCAKSFWFISLILQYNNSLIFSKSHFPPSLKLHFTLKHFWAKSSAEPTSTTTAGGGAPRKQVKTASKYQRNF